MSEFAFNINGEAFEVPANATGWRVRRMRAKGAPEVVYARDGLPLVLPIDAELDDLKREVDVTGRYRLDLVDTNNKALPSAPSGYVQVNMDGTAEAMAAPKPIVATTDSVVIEAMRMNAEITKSVVERFPQMMESAAVLLRAADGAGLPARLPIALPDGDSDADDDDDGEDESDAPAGFDLNAIVAQMVPVIIAGFTSGKLKVPGLASLFDWRRAAKPAAPASTSAPETAATSATATAERPKSTKPAKSASASNAEMPPLDPAAMAHVIAIQSALEPGEVAFVQEVAKEMSPAELRAWFDKLSKLSVPDAVAVIRDLIAGDGKIGGAA